MDTLKQYDRLRESGMSDAQARAQVAAMAATEVMAKADLAETRREVKFDTAEARVESKGNFAETRTADKAGSMRMESPPPFKSDQFDGLRNDIRKGLARMVALFYAAIALMLIDDLIDG